MKDRISNWIAVAAIGAVFGVSAWGCPTSPQGPYNSAAQLATGAGLLESTFTASSRSLEAVAADDGANRSVVGLWDVKFYDSTGKVVVDEAYEIFHSDGTEMMTDTSAPATDNVCVGIYKQTGNGTYKLKHVSFVFDPAGNLLGTATFHTTVTVSANGNSFQGNTILDVFDTSGNVVFHATGPVKGTRISVD